MQFARRLSRPGLPARAVAVALTLLGVLPALLRLPKVSVVACFDVGHPLYQWVPSQELASGVHCVSAPTPIVSWTLMVAATLLVQLILLPLLLTAGAFLVRSARHWAASADRVLAAVLLQLAALFVPEQQPVPVPVRARYHGTVRTRENPRRGPPCCN